MGLHSAAVEATHWRGAKQMEEVHKHGWDCAEVRETGFLQGLADDDKRRIPEKTLASRMRRDGQDISRMPEHTKEQKAAMMASYRKGKL